MPVSIVIPFVLLQVPRRARSCIFAVQGAWGKTTRKCILVVLLVVQVYRSQAAPFPSLMWGVVFAAYLVSGFLRWAVDFNVAALRRVHPHFACSARLDAQKIMYASQVILLKSCSPFLTAECSRPHVTIHQQVGTCVLFCLFSLRRAVIGSFFTSLHPPYFVCASV